MASLLGEDGKGYELSKKLESFGIWRSWLGESNYHKFIPSLTSPSSWDSFMAIDENKSRANLQLQIRVRALLLDKASSSLFLRPGSSAHPSRLNPNYLQLHADDVYLTLESNSGEGLQRSEASNVHHNPGEKVSLPKTFSSSCQLVELPVGNGPRDAGLDGEGRGFKCKSEEHLGTWYDRWAGNHTGDGSKWVRGSIFQQNCSLGERESLKRTPDGMLEYITCIRKQKKRRQLFQGNQNPDHSKLTEVNGSSTNKSAEEENFFPEIIFPCDCVPDSAVLATDEVGGNQKVEVVGALDNLPPIISLSPIMMERLGMRPENRSRGKKRLYTISKDQMLLLMEKIIARMLANVGFEAASKACFEMLSEFIISKICNFTQKLKVLTDSYKKQFSSLELLKMFLHAIDHKNITSLVEHMKESSRNYQHMQMAMAAKDLPTLQQNSFLQQQQMNRQLASQCRTFSPQALQQLELDKLRRLQPGIHGSIVIPEKESPIANVKIDRPLEQLGEGSFNNSLFHRQFKHQQMVMASSHQAGQLQQFKQMGNHLQMPHIQSQGSFPIRSPQPVKVDGFQELMGGDAALVRHEPGVGDDPQLKSPPNT